MTDISIGELAKQFEGRKFGELILHHIDKQSLEETIASMKGTIDMLPPQAREEVTELLDNANSLARQKEFWNTDCGEALGFITSLADRDLQRKGIHLSEEDLFNVFNIIVMNFAYSSHLDSRMKSFIKSSIAKSFFARIFG